jgi:hypothetical protein
MTTLRLRLSERVGGCHFATALWVSRQRRAALSRIFDQFANVTLPPLHYRHYITAITLLRY